MLRDMLLYRTIANITCMQKEWFC